jgi:putative glycerol-1-phosphate prenyltransferase
MSLLHLLQQETGKIGLLIDPDKSTSIESLTALIEKCNTSIIDYVLVGGSRVTNSDFHQVVEQVKKVSDKPVIIFPGDYQQVSNHADALLFLQLISGRNPEYLIEHHVKSAAAIIESGIECIPTSYLLIDGKNVSSVSTVSQTTPIKQDNTNLIVATALAGQLLGHQLIYLEAGSGAKVPVSNTVIQLIKSKTQLPIIVGGGIRDIETIQQMQLMGVNLIVIGTAFEENPTFLNALNNASKN